MRVKYLQEGGPMPAEGQPMAEEVAPQEATANEQEQVMQQIYQMAQQVILQLGPEAAMMLAQAIIEMVQGSAQEEAPMPAPEEQPVYKIGGKLVQRGRR